MTSIKSKAKKRYSKIRPSYIIIFKLQFPHTHKFSIFSKIPNHLLYFELIVSDICFMLLTKKYFSLLLMVRVGFMCLGMPRKCYFQRLFVHSGCTKRFLCTSYIHSNLDFMYVPQNCSVGSVKFCITSLLQIFFLSHF